MVTENSQNLTRAQAQFQFVNGKKIGHKLFAKGEYVVLNEKREMVDETNQVLDKRDFWLQRAGKKHFDDGWFVIE